MHGLETMTRLNAEAAIRGILLRAKANNVQLTRADVLEELKYRESDDTSAWSATVDRLMGVQS